jgi:hypothetical protein
LPDVTPMYAMPNIVLVRLIFSCACLSFFRSWVFHNGKLFKYSLKNNLIK